MSLPAAIEKGDHKQRRGKQQGCQGEPPRSRMHSASLLHLTTQILPDKLETAAGPNLGCEPALLVLGQDVVVRIVTYELAVHARGNPALDEGEE